MARSPSLRDALEACRQRLARGESIEDCLAAYPAYAEELSGLLPLVQRAQALRQQPDPTFAVAARQRFLYRVRAEREAQLARQHIAWPVLWLRRLAVPVALVLLLALSGVGLLRASADALPDSPLYPVQQVSQQVQRRFKVTPAEQAIFDLAIAQKRLQQLQTAELMGANATTLDRIAMSMVQATSRAGAEIALTHGAAHDQLVAHMAPLLAREAQALREQSSNQNQTVAASASRMQTQVAGVQARVRQAAAPTPRPAVASPRVRATPTPRPTPTARPNRPGPLLRQRLQAWWIRHHQQPPPTRPGPCATPGANSTVCGRAPVHATPTPRLTP